jgi:RNA polymerase sigma-70 factor (ECF subfamily)
MDEKDKKAFVCVYGRHFRDVYAYVAYRLMPDREGARDITQEVFLAAMKGFSQYRGDASHLTWLRSIARFKIADHLRLRVLSAGSVSSLDLLAQDAFEQLSQREEQAQLVSAVMRELPVKYADLLEEKYLEGLSVADIARRRGESDKAVESNLSRARDAFRQAFARMNQAKEITQ